jgi:hypothetical protein
MNDSCASLKVAGTPGDFKFVLTIYAMDTYTITEVSPRSYYANGLVSGITVLLDSASGGGDDFIAELPYLQNYKTASCAATHVNSGPYYTEELEIHFTYTTGTSAASCQGGGTKKGGYTEAGCS